MSDVRPLPLRSFEDEALAQIELDKAREILRGAIAEREKIRERARQEGFERGFAEGREAASVDAREKLSREAAPLADVLRAAAAAVGEKRAELAVAAERELVRLAVRIAEKVVKAEVESGSRVAIENLRRAVALAARRREVRVRLNPADLEAVEKFLPELRRELVDLGDVKLEADPAVERGGAVVVTPEGTVDADLRTQLLEIERGLLG